MRGSSFYPRYPDANAIMQNQPNHHAPNCPPNSRIERRPVQVEERPRPFSLDLRSAPVVEAPGRLSCQLDLQAAQMLAFLLSR